MNPFIPQSVQQDIILASKSPRRADILTGMRIPFRVETPSRGLEAGLKLAPPPEYTMKCATAKGEDVARRFPDSIVLAADTVVVIDGEAVTKPVNDRQARVFLSRLSGRAHEVMTAVNLRIMSRDINLTGNETTRVIFRQLRADDITAYVATGEGEDKAGSYAAQGLGSGLIQSIDGCYFNVVGLPVARTIDLFHKLAIRLIDES